MPAARKSGASHLIGLLPRAGQLPDPVRRVARPARRVLGRARWGAVARRTPASAPASRAGGRQRLARQPGPPGSPGGAPAYLSRGPPQKRGGPASRALSGRWQPLCLRAGPREQASCCASARHRGRSLPRPAIPVPAAGISPGREMRLTSGWTGAGAYHSPCTSRVPAGVPPMDLAAKQQASGEFDPARAGRPGSRPGPGRCPPGPGHCQVHGRSTPGRREVCGRAARGRSQVCARSMAAGCMGFRTRPLPVTRSPSCVMTPGPAARPAGQQTASQSRRPCWPPRSPAAACSARWIPRTRPSGR